MANIIDCSIKTMHTSTYIYPFKQQYPDRSNQKMETYDHHATVTGAYWFWKTIQHSGGARPVTGCVRGAWIGTNIFWSCRRSSRSRASPVPWTGTGHRENSIPRQERVVSRLPPCLNNKSIITFVPRPINRQQKSFYSDIFEETSTFRLAQVKYT